jgi:sec-independent protein translocase protein TatB
MGGIGWVELIVIGIVALIVVGPKDLPGMFRTVGRFMGKARGMARDFQRSMEDAAREADVDMSDLKESASTLRGLNNIGLDSASDHAKAYAKSFVSDKDDKTDVADEVPKPPKTEKAAPKKAAAKKPAAKKTAAKKTKSASTKAKATADEQKSA